MEKRVIEINPQFKQALELMDGSFCNVFITGKAGTGKSTLLDYFRKRTKKNVAVLAPTGVAAINVRGETIHSFFRFKPDITVDKIKPVRGKLRQLYQEIDSIIIDEISMVRADLLDCIDGFLRKNGRKKDRPFGGVQMIFIGDLYQLPPVVTAKEKELFSGRYPSPFFFSADVFKDLPMELIELEKIYRQKDEKFINLLNAIRNNTITNGHLADLNTRIGAVFPKSRNSLVINLTTTNKEADAINIARLNKLKTKIYTSTAEIHGDFERNSYPTQEELQIAEGAQVMALNNDPMGRWVNGSIGQIVSISHDEDEETVSVKFRNGNIEEIKPFTWEIFHFNFNERAFTLETKTVGTFTQYPLKLAWAITVHKSQGKTFERAVIDMGPSAFAGGQTYVALSRCTSFEGISLKREIKKHHIFVDWRIREFLTKYQYKLSDNNMPFDKKIDYIKEALRDKKNLAITYLKRSDEKSRRIITPYKVGEMFYEGKPFTGIHAYCHTRKSERTFRVDRILEMEVCG